MSYKFPKPYNHFILLILNQNYYMKRKLNLFVLALFILMNWATLSVQAQCTNCLNIPPPYDECTAPTSGYDAVVTVTGNQTWTTLLAGINPEDMNKRIKIVGTGTLRVVNGNLKMSTNRSLIVVDGPELIVNNGNLIFESGAIGIFKNVRLRTFSNIQQTTGSTLCITDSEVEVGEEAADGLFNTTGNTYSAANFQNDGGHRYLNTVCMNVTHDYQLQSTTATGGQDILINVCAEIGDKGGTHARTGTLDGDDSGNFQNSADMRIYNSRFWVIENVQNQSNSRMLTCDVAFRTTNGNFQNNGILSGCDLCVWIDNAHLMQNNGNWTATFHKRRANTQGSYPSLPDNISETDIKKCFVMCCEDSNPMGSIGNFVWNDTNKNGLQDGGETGVANVTIQLKNCNGTVLKTTTTDANGFYIFPNLQPGCYRIGLVLPSGFQITLANQGTNDATDSDVNPITAMTDNIDLDISEHDVTQDIGIFSVCKFGSIGDFIFYDHNSNGIFDTGDSPQAGVFITLLDGNGFLIATTMTDVYGKYLFSNLVGGTYTVNFPSIISSGKIINGQTSMIVALADCQHFVDADRSYRPRVGRIGDFIFSDDNNNGIYDRGEEPQPGVLITLCDANNVSIATTTTDSLGRYVFSNLVAATYCIVFPMALTDGKILSTPNQIRINLSAGQNFFNGDAGYFNPLNTTYARKNNGQPIFELAAAPELHSIKLGWVNNTGNKNDFFEVEKLSSASGQFEKIALINSQNGDKLAYYTATDATPTEGDNSYRISLTGTDGTKKVSNISTVKFSKTNDFRIFPNPAVDYIEVDLKQYEGKAVTLQVYDNFGKLVLTQSVEKASSTPVNINLNQTTNGQYLLRVTSEGRKPSMRKFFMQH
jgi:SdrD B-like domain/Secretion system C-terminal sorting domain